MTKQEGNIEGGVEIEELGREGRIAQAQAVAGAAPVLLPNTAHPPPRTCATASFICLICALLQSSWCLMASRLVASMYSWYFSWSACGEERMTGKEGWRVGRVRQG